MIREKVKMLLNAKGIEYYHKGRFVKYILGNSQFYLEKIAWQN